MRTLSINEFSLKELYNLHILLRDNNYVNLSRQITTIIRKEVRENNKNSTIYEDIRFLNSHLANATRTQAPIPRYKQIEVMGETVDYRKAVVRCLFYINEANEYFFITRL